MLWRRGGSALLVCVIAVLIASCGGSSGSGSTSITVTTSSLNKAQYIRRAKPLCMNGTAPILPRLGAYEKQHPYKSKAEHQKVTGEGLRAVIPPVMDSVVERLRALGAPSGDEAEIEAFLLALQGDIDVIRKGPLLKVEQLEEPFRDSGRLASAYGLETCSYG